MAEGGFEMGARRYTVAELEDLRFVCELKLFWGSYNGPKSGSGSCVGRIFDPVALQKQVEEMVRTHMLAGHTAGELRAYDDQEAVG